MATVEKINLIMGPFGGNLANAGATINEKEKMLLMAVSGDTKTTKSGNKLLVRLQTTPSVCAPPYGEFLMKQGLDTMAVIYDSTDWGVDWAKNFEKGYKGAGGKIVYMESTATLKETDYYAMATKVRGLNPKALLIVAWDEPSALIAKQSREIGYKGTLCFTNQLRDKGIKIAGVQNLAGSFTGGGTEMGTKNMPAGMAKYFDMYKKKYPDQTPAGSGMLIFDAWIALAKAMELAGTTTDVYKIRAALDKAMAKMPIQVNGTYKGLTPGGQPWGNGTVITKIGQDGVPQIITSLPITYKDAAAGEPKM
jgi:branched-chain amino acid transport system substrate-binding protein